MSDAETTNKDTDGNDKAQKGHDAWDRQVVDPDDPRFVEVNRNRENVEDFGVVSAEIAAAGDNPEKPAPEESEAPAEDNR
jgi:hypothetical protein